MTTAEIWIDHLWIRENGEAPDKPLDITVISRMKQFRTMNKLKKVALKIVAENLFEEEITGLKEMFRSLDPDNSGTITLEELRSGLPKLGTKISESEITQLMEAADVDGNGTIDYSKFVSATRHMNRIFVHHTYQQSTRVLVVGCPPTKKKSVQWKNHVVSMVPRNAVDFSSVSLFDH